MVESINFYTHEGASCHTWYPVCANYSIKVEEEEGDEVIEIEDLKEKQRLLKEELAREKELLRDEKNKGQEH